MADNMTRFFAAPADIAENTIHLSDENAAHIRSLRLRPDELFIVCDGLGKDHVCHLGDRDDSGSIAEIVETRPSRGEPKIYCVVFIAFAKGDRLDYATQKSVELGARKITLFPSERCISLSDIITKKTARLQKIALEAAKQSGRGCIPRVTAADTFDAAIGLAAHAGLSLFFYEHEEKLHLKQVLQQHDPTQPPNSVSIVTGPEGGFTPQEAALARSSGLVQVTLGPRILRCETAPAAALAAIMYHTGNL